MIMNTRRGLCQILNRCMHLSENHVALSKCRIIWAEPMKTDSRFGYAFMFWIYISPVKCNNKIMLKIINQVRIRVDTSNEPPSAYTVQKCSWTNWTKRTQPMRIFRLPAKRQTSFLVQCFVHIWYIYISIFWCIYMCTHAHSYDMLYYIDMHVYVCVCVCGWDQVDKRYILTPILSKDRHYS